MPRVLALILCLRIILSNRQQLIKIRGIAFYLQRNLKNHWQNVNLLHESYPYINSG
jgi:hypothetical protein